MPQKGSNLHRKENRFLEMCKHKLSIPRSQSSNSACQGLSVGHAVVCPPPVVYKENVLDLLLRKTRMNFRRVGEHERPFTE